MNGDNDIQTTFIFQRNLHTDLNTCPTVSQVPGYLRRKIFCRRGKSPPADRLDVRHPYSFALPRTSEPNYGLLDVTGNVHRTWAAFVCGYPLLPYRLPTKTAQRHVVLLWYTSSGAPPSCNSCSVSTVMRIPIVARHNKTRQCSHLAVTVSRT
jgi:hypothetical protein